MRDTCPRDLPEFCKMHERMAARLGLVPGRAVRGACDARLHRMRAMARLKRVTCVIGTCIAGLRAQGGIANLRKTT